MPQIRIHTLGISNRANQTNRQRNASGKDLDACFFYFYHLHEKEIKPEEFKQQWQKLSAINFNSKQLSLILYSAAKAVTKTSEHTRAEIKGFLKNELHRWESTALKKIASFNPQNLANSLWAFGKLGIPPSRQFMEEWEKQAERNFSQFNSQNFGNSLWAFATLEIPPSRRFLQTWEKQAEPILPQFNAQDLCNSIWAFATLGTLPSEKFLQAWENQAESHIHQFNRKDLSNSLWAFAKLSVSPAKKFLHAWEKQAENNLSSFTAQDLSNSLWAYATLGIPPSEKFLHAWEKQAEGNLSQFSTQHLATSLWSLAVMAVLKSERKIPPLVHKICPKLDKVTLNSEDKQQSNDACLYFGLPPVCEKRRATECSSLTEQRLSAIFAQVANPAKERGQIAAMNHQVDIPLLYRGKRILIEFDGPSHFIRGSHGAEDRYNGQTLLQSALIHQCEPDAIIIRLRVHEEPKLMNGGGHPQALRRLLDKAIQNSRSVYESCAGTNDAIDLKDHLPSQTRYLNPPIAAVSSGLAKRAIP